MLWREHEDNKLRVVHISGLIPSWHIRRKQSMINKVKLKTVIKSGLRSDNIIWWTNLKALSRRPNCKNPIIITFQDATSLSGILSNSKWAWSNLQHFQYISTIAVCTKISDWKGEFQDMGTNDFGDSKIWEGFGLEMEWNGTVSLGHPMGWVKRGGGGREGFFMMGFQRWVLSWIL